jgi:cell division septum initiation protein DivIVA
MNMRVIGRKLRQTFGISAPRMAVRTHLSWRWKVPALLLSLAVVAGMWWWGFDFGQILGGFNRSAVAEKQAQLETDLEQTKAENARLRTRVSELESDLNITRGAETALSKQALELESENTQIKEQLAFLQKLSSDSGKQGTITIQRMSAEPERDNSYHFSLLIVRGGNPVDDFTGQLSLHAGLVSNGRPATLVLPDDQPEAAAALKLKFKYYQRIEGTIRIPAGSQLRTLQARVLETGQSQPKATRSLNLS